MGNETIKLDIKLDASGLKKELSSINEVLDEIRNAINKAFDPSGIDRFTKGLHEALKLGNEIVGFCDGFGKLNTSIKGIVKIIQAFINTVGLVNIELAVVVFVIGGLIVIIAKLADCFMNGSKEAREFTAEMKKKNEAAKELNKTYEDMKQQQQDSWTAGSLEIKYIQELKDKLTGLADEKGNVSEEDRAQADFILGTLNNALGEEYKMVDGQIKEYGKLCDSVDNYIENAKKRMQTEVLESEYKEIYLTKMKSQQEFTKLQMDLDKARADGNTKAAREIEEAMNTLADTIEDCNQREYVTMKAMELTYNDQFEAAEECFRNVNGAALENADIVTSAEKEITDNIKKEKEEQIKETAKKVAQSIDMNQDEYDDLLFMAGKYSKSAEKQSKETGKNIISGYEEALNANKGKLFDTMDNTMTGSFEVAKIAVGVNSPSKKFMELGKNIIEGANEGVTNNKDSFIKKTSNIFSSAVDKVKKALGINSPSRVFAEIGANLMSGFVIGIKDNAGRAINAVEEVFDEISNIGSEPFLFYGGISGATLPQIPKLATGMVIPPNREFMAILGDQKRGMNIETPEALLRKIINEEGNDKPITLINKVYLDGKQIAESTNEYNANLRFATNGGKL